LAGRKNIPETVKLILWGKASGRCEYEGCNHPLWKDDLTKAEFNSAYIAHIIAASPDGPRGDTILSPQLEIDESNLMLMCDPHHRLIDKHDVGGHPVERLREMKRLHEERIELQTGVDRDRRSYLLIYSPPVGDHALTVDPKHCALGMVPDFYPASNAPLLLSQTNSMSNERSSRYWEQESEALESAWAVHVEPKKRANLLHHVSVFALAPQPLLVKLGFMLSDLTHCRVHQPIREPKGWKWREESEEKDDYIVERPSADQKGPPALVLGTTNRVEDDRVHEVLPDARIWRVTVEHPHSDFLQTESQLSEFRGIIRPLLDEIKDQYGGGTAIHVFPAAAAAICVELGRCIQPRAIPTLEVYDQSRAGERFLHALTVGRAGTSL